MKINLTLLFFLLLCCFQLQAGEIVLRGVYQGKNLYVQNPFTADKSRFCTMSVYVNDKLLLSDPKTSSFEINLSFLSMNQEVVVRIVHADGCKPKIINAVAIKPNDTFQFTSFIVDESVVRWNATGESPNSVYYVEKFVNNNWFTIKTVTSTQSAQAGMYAVPVKHPTGITKYRIKHQERDGQIFYSQTLTYNAVQEQVKFYPKNVTNKIYLTAEAAYEILDVNGKLLFKGQGKEIDATKLGRGVYYLSIEGRAEKFLKK
jgi:hypothetical protein